MKVTGLKIAVKFKQESLQNYGKILILILSLTYFIGIFKFSLHFKETET